MYLLGNQFSCQREQWVETVWLTVTEAGEGTLDLAAVRRCNAQSRPHLPWQPSAVCVCVCLYICISLNPPAVQIRDTLDTVHDCTPPSRGCAPLSPISRNEEVLDSGGTHTVGRLCPVLRVRVSVSVSISGV